jgi:3-phenylpropionate/trans-cinnamate dioxygenase ferredoxin subunit
MRIRQSKPQPDEGGFYPAIPVAELSEDSAIRLTINGQAILVTKYEGDYYAFSAYCPHAAGDLANGQLYKGRIDCPEHAYRFDIRSGRTLWPPDESYRLKTYPLKINGGKIHILVT